MVPARDEGRPHLFHERQELILTPFLLLELLEPLKLRQQILLLVQR